MAFQSALEKRQIVVDEFVDQFGDAGTALAGRDVIRMLLEHRQGIRHSGGTFTQCEKSVVVLGVADSHGFMGGQAELLQRRL